MDENELNEYVKLAEKYMYKSYILGVISGLIIGLSLALVFR